MLCIERESKLSTMGMAFCTSYAESQFCGDVQGRTEPIHAASFGDLHAGACGGGGCGLLASRRGCLLLLVGCQLRQQRVICSADERS